MTPVLGVVGDVVGGFGAFLIPVVLFVVGVTFYVVLYYLGRTDIAGLDEPIDPDGAGDAWDARADRTAGPQDERDDPGPDDRAASEGASAGTDAADDDRG